MNDRAEAKPGLARFAPLALALMVAAWAAWRLTTLSLAEHFSVSNPAAALAWRAGDPEALLQEFGPLGSNHADTAQQIAAAKAGIRNAPLDGRGYRLLAQQAERNHDLAAADRLYGLAAARGPRDLPSLGWLINRRVATGDYRQALAFTDQMLRVQPELISKLEPMLVSLVDTTSAQSELASVLKTQPPWRQQFLVALSWKSKNSVALFGLMEDLRTTPPGLSDDELSAWLNRLASQRQWGAAYLVWVQSLDAEARQHIGNVFDGGFEREPGNTGFGWRFDTVPGAIVSREKVPGGMGGEALRIDFGNERVPFKNVRQLLALPPGTYELQGRVRLDDLRSQRGLVWTLTCAEDSRVIAETEPMSGHRPWGPFSLELLVPADACGGQWLTLRIPARIRAEQLVGGTAWFDDLQIQAVHH